MSNKFVAAVVLVLGSITVAQPVFAQEYAPDTDSKTSSKDAHPKNAVTLNPLPLVAGIVSVEYERAVHDRVSLFLQPSVIAFKGAYPKLPEDSSLWGLGANAGARLFVTGRAPEGFWIGPQAGVAYVNATLHDVNGSAVGYSAGGLVGYTWLFGDVVDLSVGGGAGYVNTKVRVEDSEVGYEGVEPLLRLAVGVAF